MKKIISFVVMAICLAMSASAQVVNVENFAECKAYLNNHPTDTVFGKDSKGTDFAVYRTADGKIHRDAVKVVTVVKTDTVFIGPSPEVLASVNDKAVNNLLNEKVVDKDGDRDAFLGFSPDLYRYQIEHGMPEEDAGKIHQGPAANKFGGAIEAFAGAGYENSFKPFAGLGLVYTRRLWEVALRVGMSSRNHTPNSENEGSYMTFMSSFMAGPGISFGHYATEKISILGGVNFESYKTDSKINAEGSRFKSWGSSLQGAVELKYRHRFFRTGNAMSFSLGYVFRGNVVQNSEDISANYAYMTMAFELGIARQKANYDKLPKTVAY
jgi:hypothetical protein